MATHQELSQRIARVRATKGLTGQAFADALGVSRSYLSQVEHGQGKPSIEMVLGIAAAFPDVSRDWLLTGEGAMLLGEADSGIAKDKGPMNVVAITQARERRFVEKLRLEEIAIGARFSKHFLQWMILGALVHCHPRAMSLKEIASSVSETDSDASIEDIAFSLVTAVRAGLVEQCAEDSFRVGTGSLLYRTQSQDEFLAHAKEAIVLLTRGIIPRLRLGGADTRLVTAKMLVPQGAGRTIIEEALAELKKCVYENADKTGTEMLELVFGISLQTGGR